MTRHSLPVGRLPAARLIPTVSGRGQLSLLSVAVALALGLVGTDASALSLGRLNVQSALGEPLRAEIEVTEISAAEADSMKLNIASADAFRAAGVGYNAALSDVRTVLQRRADGRYVVRLTGNRSLNDPFIDLLLEANWGSGRVVRDYTVLLDPPSSRQAATAAAQTSSNAPQIGVAPRAAPPVMAQAAPRRQRPVAPPAAPAPAADSAVRTGSGEGQQVTVRPGDTASKIAGAYKPADVSLDQMLVALLRNNPDAFIGGNMNRMKAGAVINVPSAAQAVGTAPDEAKRTVTAQSRDFNDYRQQLAGNAPTSKVAGADRQAGGKVQTNVEDRNAAAASPDKLTVSQGVAAKAAADKLAQARQTQENSARVAELSKNITDLNKLQTAANAPAPAATTPAPTGGTAAAPAATPPTPAAAPAAPAAAATPAAPAAPATPAANVPGVTVPVATPDAVAPAASSPAATPAATPASAPEAAKPPAAAPAKVTPPPQQGFFAELMDNPLMLGGAALIALLIAFLLYRVLGRKRQDAGDSVFLESRMPKDSFFGASGGESVDTKNRNSSIASSLSYSPSQLDAGDVDPVAEADVYLAYGRDLQAEEILREALRTSPERTAIHLKLLEIHAKRRDLRAYEALAADVHKLTGGTGNEWNRVVEMGRDLDPGNPLYQAGVRPAAAAVAAPAEQPVTMPMDLPTTPIVPEPVAPPPAFVPSVAPLDFDLDLSKPAPLAPAAAPVPTPPSASLPPVPQVRPPAAAPDINYEQTVRGSLGDGHDVDLENDFDTAPAALEPVTRIATQPDEDRTQPATLRAGLPGESGFIEFDMSAMTGRAPLETERGGLESLDDAESPHAIKLSLARELQAIGDAEGARSLVEEVAAEASGDLKAQARQLLTQLA
ncbi:FimV/HubP family polar landmark protein [Variovorax fucosicus]|uniref:FimV/HubP family polar landmark protein n=1 Tax=Variovorax fucosicus TaxID=3053517 RepID=UPI0025776A33|nr:FimV/HubP family polar landmark protein [Variovorax sp. J22G47]MDM0058353.1 FimV/HubP family polar landmark protein [Variovorax sp. J22G47]